MWETLFKLWLSFEGPSTLSSDTQLATQPRENIVVHYFFFLSSLVFAPFITDCTIQIPRETKIHQACLEVNNFTDVIKICIDVFSLHQRLIWLQELFDYLKQLKYIYITVYIAVHKSFWITVVSFSSMKYNVLTAIFELFLWDGSIRYSV